MLLDGLICGRGGCALDYLLLVRSRASACAHRPPRRCRDSGIWGGDAAGPSPHVGSPAAVPTVPADAARSRVSCHRRAAEKRDEFPPSHLSHTAEDLALSGKRLPHCALVIGSGSCSERAGYLDCNLHRPEDRYGSPRKAQREQCFPVFPAIADIAGGDHGFRNVPDTASTHAASRHPFRSARAGLAASGRRRRAEAGGRCRHAYVARPARRARAALDPRASAAAGDCVGRRRRPLR